MPRKGAIIVPILIVLLIISSAFSAVSFYLYQKEHTYSGELKSQVTDLEGRLRSTEDKFSQAKKEASELTLKLQESDAKITELTDDLDHEKSRFNQASGQLAQLKSDLDKQKSMRLDLENKLKSAQDEGKQVKEQIKLIQQQKIELEEKIKSMETGSEGVELGKVIVNTDSSTPGAAKEVIIKTGKADVKITPPAAPLEGKIMIVNKEFNFAVINLGARDNIKTGDEFSVYHEGGYLGDLKAEKVHETMTAAGFPAELKDLIKENDKIIKKAK